MKTPSKASTPTGQNELSVILDGVEALSDFENCADCDTQLTELLQTYPALVKALRRATVALEILNDGSFPIPRSDISIGIVLREITAILKENKK